MTTTARVATVLSGLGDIRDQQEALYRDLHQNPELSHQEHRSAGIVAGRLRESGYSVHEGVGGTGVVAVLQNGDGPTVLLRADMDALPIREATGLPYASTSVATDPAGVVGTHTGPVLSAADSMRITVHGRGGHGSMPQATVDPVVLAAMIVIRLQTVVARETAPAQAAVLTVGRIVARTKSNVIPDHAVLELNVRTYSEATRTEILDAIRRIVVAECHASRSPREPEFELFDRFPLTVNDPEITDRVTAAFAEYFGDRSVTMPLQAASEDFSDIPNALGVPYTYWGIGGTHPDTYRKALQARRIAQDIPVNHSATFAPVIQPTLDTGTEALVVAALAWL